MTDFQKGIIRLMKCAVTGEETALPEGFFMEEAEAFSVKQHITTLVYDGAVKCGIPSGDPVMQQMFRRYLQQLLRSERQLTQLRRIFTAFDGNGIDYLPLKGSNMKFLYPKAEFRYMGDADILIRLEQYDRIRVLMQELGMTEGPENHHEYHWYCGDLHVELHKMPIPPTNPAFCAYWKSGWERAEWVSGSRYRLKPEDDLLFQITHFAKHYMGEGIGCRYLLDLWIYLRANPYLDEGYLNGELEKLHLLDFYRHVRDLVSVWFEGKESDERMDFMTDFLFSGSSWGSWQQGQLSAAVKNRPSYAQNKFFLILRKLFPPLSGMNYRYPILKKAPILLPICWVLRLGENILLNPQKRKRGMHMITDVSNESIDRHKGHMRFVGLYFDEE